MKSVFGSILIFTMCVSASAQLVITPGAQLYMQNSSEITLENIDLVNNGDFIAGTSTIFFTGSPLANISGSSPLSFYNLSLDKAPNSVLRLQRSINVTHNIIFNTGVLDLNAFDVNLSTTGSLVNESETSRIVGSAGGHVLANMILNTPLSVNPGHLGATITSANDLGNVIIRRGHQQQSNVSGASPGIFRYYEIIPENFTDLKMNLRLSYFDIELTDINETGLVIWRKDGENWTNLGFSTRNTTENFVEKDGIGSLSRFTLAHESANPLTKQETFKGNVSHEHKIKEAIYVWPNPVADRVNVSIYSLTDTQVNLILFDIKGALIYTETKQLKSGINQLQVKLSQLPAGVYTLKSVWGNNNKVIKLVKP